MGAFGPETRSKSLRPKSSYTRVASVMAAAILSSAGSYLHHWPAPVSERRRRNSQSTSVIFLGSGVCSLMSGIASGWIARLMAKAPPYLEGWMFRTCTHPSLMRRKVLPEPEKPSWRSTGAKIKRIAVSMRGGEVFFMMPNQPQNHKVAGLLTLTLKIASQLSEYMVWKRIPPVRFWRGSSPVMLDLSLTASDPAAGCNAFVGQARNVCLCQTNENSSA